jgi:hypothetical protein
MQYYDEMQEIRNEFKELDTEDFSEAEQNARLALYEKYEKRGILLAAYHIWENGHVQGDASDEEMQNDAIALVINVAEEGWEDTLFEKLNTEFVELFREELEGMVA